MKKKLAGLLALCLTLTLTVLPASAALSVENARTLLEAYYVDEVPQSVLEKETLEEMLEALDDPYTTYMTAEEYKAFMESVNGQELAGVGLGISKTADEDGVLILSVLVDSPAREAKLQPGDRITAIDGVRVTPDMDYVSAMRGEEGTQLKLTIRPMGRSQERTCTLTRKILNTPTVSGELIDAMGYIECTSFGEHTGREMEDAVRTLMEDSAVLTIDLRGNPGGEVGAVGDVLGLFTDENLVVTFNDHVGTNLEVTMDHAYKAEGDKPLIVMTSPYSASGAEIFAAAVRDYDLGLTIGQRTFGKGIAQVVLNDSGFPHMFDGDNLKITAYRFYSPKGITNHVVGVIPTVMMSGENTPAAAMLLSAELPSHHQNMLKLELGSETFYINEKEAAGEDFRDAFTELLEALPEAASLAKWGGWQGWLPVTREELAQEMGLDYQPRTFDDISQSEYLREINTLALYDMVSGVGGGSFDPTGDVTRAEFCTMVTRALNLRIPENPTAFTDVAENAWYADYVAAMEAAGFISGMGDGTFRPNDRITGQEMVAVLNNVAMWLSRTVGETGEANLDVQEFIAYFPYAEWARKAARNLGELQVLPEGLEPSADMTREQAAAMICRLLENVGVLWTAPKQ